MEIRIIYSAKIRNIPSNNSETIIQPIEKLIKYGDTRSSTQKQQEFNIYDGQGRVKKQNKIGDFLDILV